MRKNIKADQQFLYLCFKRVIRPNLLSKKSSEFINTREIAKQQWNYKYFSNRIFLNIANIDNI